MLKRFILLPLFFVLLSGCVSSQRITPDHKEKLNVSIVQVNQEVEKPDSMYYMGPGSAFGAMFGAIGGALTAAANLSPADKLRLYAEENNIHIEKIVREEVIKEFYENGGFQFSSADNHHYQLKISIPMYGFSIPNGFSSKLTPVLNIKCELFDIEGERIWASKKDVSIINGPTELYKKDEFIENPNLIEEAWRAAAKDLAIRLLEEL